MKLNDLIVKLIKDSRVGADEAGGLILFTVEMTAEQFFREQETGSIEMPFGDRDVLRTARNITLRDQTDWARYHVNCHNPHVLYTQEADIALHLWREGDNYLARCTKMRGVEQRPTEDFVLDWE